MFNKIIEPRFGHTDALGHINNVSFAKWFELARNDLHTLLYGDLTPDKWNLILAHSSYDFLKETFYGSKVEVKTYVEKIGNASFTLIHEAWQNQAMTATGKAVLVHFDFKNKKTMPLTEEIINVLQGHMVD